MRRFVLFAALMFLLVSPIGAQTAASGDGTPAKEDVMKYLQVMHIREQLVQYFGGVSKQAKLGAEEGFKQKVPNATPEQLAKVDKFAEGLFQDMPIDEMVDAMVPIYQKHLTKSDLDAILAFYATPVGQKLLREQPAMMQEATQAGGEIGRKRIGAMSEKMEDFINTMAKDGEKK
jgi:uncharacterized protein